MTCRRARIPKHIDTDLDLGVSAIGQGKVLATPLEMASVAQTIANGGEREPTSLVNDEALKSSRAGRCASCPRRPPTTMRSLMIGVVQNGTGTAAAIPGIDVAGKTGTAELGPDPTQVAPRAPTRARSSSASTRGSRAFAPASDPKLVVAALVTDASGAGGSVAAPIAREVLASALGVG